jgi:hypothetical protein
MSLRKAVAIVIDHDAKEGKDIIYDESEKVKSFALAKRVIEKIPSIPSTASEESYEVREIEGLTPEELENEGLIDDEMEFLEGEIFVPEISNESSLKLLHTAEGQDVGIYIDKINRRKFEKKYLGSKKLASFADSVVKITITGISPDYSNSKIVTAIDEALGNKTYQEEKPASKKE